MNFLVGPCNEVFNLTCLSSLKLWLVEINHLSKMSPNIWG